MPKIVDPTERREAVVDAVFAVIEEGGIDAATLSSVAARAGLSIGSVRHYFASHDELLRFAADALTSRIGDRLSARVPVASAAPQVPDETMMDEVLGLLLEVLPVDELRRRESTVWLEYAVASRTRAALASKSDRLFDGLALISRRIVDGAVARGLLPADDAADEAERLHALLDGLTMHGVLSPTVDYPDRATSILREYLRTMFKPPPAAE